MKHFLLKYGFFLSLIYFITGCNNPKINDFSYDIENKRISFRIENNIKLDMQIYWNDSLICSPYIQYNEKDMLYFIDAFPNGQIGGYSAKPYLTNICYEISKEKKLNLRYLLTYTKKDKRIPLIDTILTISNILDQEAVSRFNQKYSYPIVNLKGTGFDYLRHTDYDAVMKGLLYSEGIRNISNDVIKDAALHLNILLNGGYIQSFIPNNARFSPEIKNKLRIHIPTNISRAYLLLASLSGNKAANDFNFETNKEIAEFIATEYSHNFPNATINSNEYITIPIKKIGNHKYNFVQLLIAVYILEDNDYLAIPIGYALTKAPLETIMYNAENSLFKSIVSPLASYRGVSCINNFWIHYYATTDLF